MSRVTTPVTTRLAKSCVSGVFVRVASRIDSGAHLHETRRMKTHPRNLSVVKLALFLGCAGIARADNFGSGSNAFTIDFVNIGNAGNGNDLGAGGGSYSSPYGHVAYTYRMGVTEVAQDWITKATNLGMTNVTAGAWGEMQRIFGPAFG